MLDQRRIRWADVAKNIIQMFCVCWALDPPIGHTTMLLCRINPLTAGSDYIRVFIF